MEKISLKVFLKRYTAISNKFIDEYYKFYELCENDIYELLNLNDEVVGYEKIPKTIKILKQTKASKGSKKGIKLAKAIKKSHVEI